MCYVWGMLEFGEARVLQGAGIYALCGRSMSLERV